MEDKMAAGAFGCARNYGCDGPCNEVHRKKHCTLIGRGFPDSFVVVALLLLLLLLLLDSTLISVRTRSDCFKGSLSTNVHCVRVRHFVGPRNCHLTVISFKGQIVTFFSGSVLFHIIFSSFWDLNFVQFVPKSVAEMP